jgi:Transposase/Predicted permease
MGWQFVLAEVVGALIMVALLVLLLRRFLRLEFINEAKAQADRGIAGRMEGHAEMDMSVTEGGSLWQRIISERGLTAISHYFVMDVAAVWLDIIGGLLISGALAAWVSDQFWQSFFLVPHRRIADPRCMKLWYRLWGRQHRVAACSGGEGLMEVVHPRCGGLDVHKETVVACVRLALEGKVTREVSTFETTTSGLLLLLAWLTQLGCTHVAMEATGVYWKPVWNILSDGDFRAGFGQCRSH